MNKRYALLALTVSALVALSVFATVGGAVALADKQGEDGGRGNLGPVFNDHFNFGEVSDEGNSASFISYNEQSVNGVTTRTAFGFYASAEDVPTVAVAMLNATTSASSNGRNSSFTWAIGGIKVLGIFEYNDVAKTGVYNRSVDGQPLSSINFDEMNWVLTTKQISGPNGVQGYNANITGTKGSFVFSLSADVYDTGVTVAGTKLAPTEAKINFTIDNYPFNSSTSDLGLMISYGGQQHFGSITSIISTSTSGSGEDQIQTINKQTTATISKGAFAYFTWAPTATVDGASAKVNSEQLNNGTYARIILNYPHGTSITHDPILGVGTGSASQIPAYSSVVSALSTASLDIFLVLGSIVIVVLVSALVLAARRKVIEPRLMM